MIILPRLYAIVDAGMFTAAADPVFALTSYVGELLAGGVTLIQYRDKSDNARRMLAAARELRRAAGAQELPQGSCRVRLIMNDRADLCLAADFDGLHVGQDDLSPVAARTIVGPDKWLGVSTHNPEQVCEANQCPADYIAVGPVFETGSKANPDPAIGLDGVRRARALTAKPLVAIGGITRENCAGVIAAGADAVAVISDLAKEPRRGAREFLARLNCVARTQGV